MPKRRVSAVAILIGCVISFNYGQFVHGQTRTPIPAAGRSDSKNADPAQSPATEDSQTSPEDFRHTVYFSLVGEIVIQDAHDRESRESGRAPVVEYNYSKEFKITAEEERMLRAIILENYPRISESEQQVQILNSEFHEHPSNDLAARRDAQRDETWQIIDDIIGKLKASMGAEAFEKVNACLYDKQGRGGIIVTKWSTPRR
jgi:hypothetical protein